MPRKSTKSLTEQEKQKIYELATKEKLSSRKIGKIYNVEKTLILTVLKNKGWVYKKPEYTINKKYPFNHDFFEDINSEEKVYFLGLLYADGCVTKDKRNITISLQEKDISILEKFKKTIGSEKPLYKIKSTKKEWQNRYSLTLTSKKMCEDLIKLGCVPQKSLILKFPNSCQVPDFLLRHFIRGVFDGDGGVSFQTIYTGLKTGVAYFTSTEDFCINLAKIIEKETGINCYMRPTNGPDKPTRTLFINGNQQIYKLFEYLYSGATIWIDRKFDKFQENRLILEQRGIKIKAGNPFKGFSNESLAG